MPGDTKAHGGDIHQYLTEDVSAPGEIIDFSANINPLGISHKAKTAIIKNISQVVHYPEPDSKRLKKALGDFHNVSHTNIAAGNGSIELIYLLPKALRAKRILIITPTFSEYEFSAIANKATAIFLNTQEHKDFRLEIFSLERFIPQVDLLFLCNPNNPTGTHIDDKEISELAKRCQRHKTFLAVDEVFGDFVKTNNDSTKVLDAVKGNRYLLILRSLTKFFAIPGLRIGYLLGHRDLIKKILALQYPWNVNSLAQAAAEAVIRDREYMDKSKRYVDRERGYLFDELSRLEGLKVYIPSSNFILCRLDRCTIKSSKTLNERLIKRGIVVRNCGNFRGLSDRFFRVAVKKKQENKKLITALKEVL